MFPVDKSYQPGPSEHKKLDFDVEEHSWERLLPGGHMFGR